MKVLYIGVIALLLAGCNSAEQFTPKVVPYDLKDCKFYHMAVDGSSYRIVRCPNSSTTTTYSPNKTTQSVTVID